MKVNIKKLNYFKLKNVVYMHSTLQLEKLLDAQFTKTIKIN
jgi:hypothetical protein